LLTNKLEAKYLVDEEDDLGSFENGVAYIYVSAAML
jgi:hypothetical protein